MRRRERERERERGRGQRMGRAVRTWGEKALSRPSGLGESGVLPRTRGPAFRARMAENQDSCPLLAGPSPRFLRSNDPVTASYCEAPGRWSWPAPCGTEYGL